MDNNDKEFLDENLKESVEDLLDEHGPVALLDTLHYVLEDRILNLDDEYIREKLDYVIGKLGYVQQKFEYHWDN